MNTLLGFLTSAHGAQPEPVVAAAFADFLEEEYPAWQDLRRLLQYAAAHPEIAWNARPTRLGFGGTDVEWAVTSATVHASVLLQTPRWDVLFYSLPLLSMWDVAYNTGSAGMRLSLHGRVAAMIDAPVVTWFNRDSAVRVFAAAGVPLLPGPPPPIPPLALVRKVS